MLYLGDTFNNKGNNVALVRDRVKKGEAVMVNALALTTDAVMEHYVMQTLILLYRSVFLPVLIFNSQAWDRMTLDDLEGLTTVQLKYLKRALQVPRSTPNCAVFLELGILPIEYEIHIRKLTFLHHILHLEANDPVIQIYQEQKKYVFEKNWGNEVEELLDKYNIKQGECDATHMSKNSWKRMVKKKITEYALIQLNMEKCTKSKLEHLPDYTSFHKQNYFETLSVDHSRLLFQVRSRTLDIKAFRTWKYEDLTCRLCNDGDENIEHILNVCKNIQRKPDESYSVDEHSGLQLIKQFLEAIDEEAKKKQGS